MCCEVQWRLRRRTGSQARTDGWSDPKHVKAISTCPIWRPAQPHVCQTTPNPISTLSGLRCSTAFSVRVRVQVCLQDLRERRRVKTPYRSYKPVRPINPVDIESRPNRQERRWNYATTLKLLCNITERGRRQNVQVLRSRDVQALQEAAGQSVEGVYPRMCRYQ